MHVVSAQVLEQWNALTDEQVVTQVLSGQTALFEILMRRYNERVYRVARAIVRDDQEAEDVMQQAYVNAYAHLRQFTGKARFSTWLTKIAINESLARVRRRGKYELYDDELSNVEPLMAQNSARDPGTTGLHRRTARAPRVGHRRAAERCAGRSSSCGKSRA